MNAKIALLEFIDSPDETKKLFKTNWKTQRNENLNKMREMINFDLEKKSVLYIIQ